MVRNKLNRRGFFKRLGGLSLALPILSAFSLKLTGAIRGLTFWSRALSSNEVNKLYYEQSRPVPRARSAAESAHPELWEGLILPDISGNGNHATLKKISA